MGQPNRDALVKYLRSVGIDAHTVRDDGEWDESGYNVNLTMPDGRPLYGAGNRLKVERREWPSRTVFENVSMLYSGGSEQDLMGEPLEEAKPKKAPAAPKAPKKEGGKSE